MARLVRLAFSSATHGHNPAAKNVTKITDAMEIERKGAGTGSRKGKGQARIPDQHSPFGDQIGITKCFFAPSCLCAFALKSPGLTALIRLRAKRVSFAIGYFSSVRARRGLGAGV